MRRRQVFTCLLGLLPTCAALAHHAFGAFDMQKEATISGTVKVYQWTNPHVWIHLSVANASGKVEEWAFETASPNVIGRRGWSRDTVKPGDQVTITYHPMRGNRGGALMSLTLASGKKLGVVFA
jgi:Family of unknown function (DUF6152)